MLWKIVQQEHGSEDFATGRKRHRYCTREGTESEIGGPCRARRAQKSQDVIRQRSVLERQHRLILCIMTRVDHAKLLRAHLTLQNEA